MNVNNRINDIVRLLEYVAKVKTRAGDCAIRPTAVSSMIKSELSHFKTLG
jgi:hypothetical protein